MAIIKVNGPVGITGTIPQGNIANASLGAVTALPSGLGGKFLQVQQVQSSTDTTISGNTWTDVGGMTIDVTPVSSTSKFLLTCDVWFRLFTNSSNAEPNSNLRFLKDGSALFTEVTWGGSAMKQESARTDTFGAIRDTRIFLDSGASHSAGTSVTFKIQAVTEGSAESISFNESNINSRLQVMEIEA